SAKDVAAAVSEEFADPIFDLSTFNYAAMSQNILSVDLIEKHRAIPLIKRSGRLSVALSDPSNINAWEEIRFNTGMLIDPIVVEQDKHDKLIEKKTEETEQAAYGNLGTTLDKMQAVL